MKPLIAVLSCHRFRHRADAVRETWGRDLQDADLRVFLGRGDSKRPDEVILPVEDDYRALPSKLRATCIWARDHGYKNLYKADDDSYVVPERLLSSGFEREEYTGRVRGPSGPFPAPYCSGFGYWLGSRAISIIADSELNGDTAEDRYVANTLLKAGIRPRHDPRYAVISSDQNARSASEPPRPGNSLIAVCEFTPKRMREIHAEWISGRPSTWKPYPMPTGRLSCVSILIKTFLRDEYLYPCIDSIEKNLPEAKIVIVDDGYEASKKITLYADLRDRGHACAWLPFDSGFGAKANEGLKYCDRPFVLIGSDDFDFSQARPGIENMITVMEHDNGIQIASGRVNSRPYESELQISEDQIREIPLRYRETRKVCDVTYRICDLTVNYSLIRRACLGPGPDRLHWDENVKIGGGEHGAFFLDAKRLGFGVCVVEGAVIREMPFNYAFMHPSYPQYRKRAGLPGRICLKNRGIDHWVLQDGTVEVT